MTSGHTILIKNLKTFLKTVSDESNFIEIIYFFSVYVCVFQLYYKEGANGKMTSYAQYSPYWCLNCVSSYDNKDTFELHKNFCVNSSGQLEEYPIFGVNDVLKFSHHDNQYKQEITGKVSFFLQ